MDRKIMYALLVIVVIVIAVVLVYLSTSAGQGSGTALAQYINQPASPSVLASLNIPNNMSDAILTGSAEAPTKIAASPLMSNGKPELLYIGAEYCPYCATTRWGLIIALMRFGTFSNLHYTISNTSDPAYPGTPTFTFYNSTYSSAYVNFTAVETETQNEKPLQTPTPEQAALFSKFGVGGGIPFIDFGNLSIQNGAPISPQVLVGYNWDSIAQALSQQNSPVAQAVIGSANIFTAQICMMTNNQPTSVCSQPYVTTIQKEIG